MEDIVLNIDQCRHLQELGLDMGNARLWYCVDNGSAQIVPSDSHLFYTPFDEFIPTYTLQEIWDKLPPQIGEYYHLKINTLSNVFYYEHEYGEDSEFDYGDPRYLHKTQPCSSILETAYLMLCWVVANGYLKVI